MGQLLQRATPQAPEWLRFVGTTVLQRDALCLIPAIVLVAFEDSVSERDARFIMDTLQDARSWTRFGMRFKQVASTAAKHHIRIIMASPARLKALFPTADMEKWSVTKGDEFPVPIYFNTDNWEFGIRTSGHATVAEYRQYVINHEVGHALGFSHLQCGCADEAACSKDACIMQQQTHGTQGCQPTSWPSNQSRCLQSVWHQAPHTLDKHYRRQLDEKTDTVDPTSALWKHALHLARRVAEHYEKKSLSSKQLADIAERALAVKLVPERRSEEKDLSKLEAEVAKRVYLGTCSLPGAQ